MSGSFDVLNESSRYRGLERDKQHACTSTPEKHEVPQVLPDTVLDARGLEGSAENSVATGKEGNSFEPSVCRPGVFVCSCGRAGQAS